MEQMPRIAEQEVDNFDRSHDGPLPYDDPDLHLQAMCPGHLKSLAT